MNNLYRTLLACFSRTILIVLSLGFCSAAIAVPIATSTIKYSCTSGPIGDYGMYGPLPLGLTDSCDYAVSLGSTWYYQALADVSTALSPTSTIHVAASTYNVSGGVSSFAGASGEIEYYFAIKQTQVPPLAADYHSNFICHNRGGYSNTY